jgi:hypothetical protein
VSFTLQPAIGTGPIYSPDCANMWILAGLPLVWLPMFHQYWRYIGKQWSVNIVLSWNMHVHVRCLYVFVYQQSLLNIVSYTKKKQLRHEIFKHNWPSSGHFLNYWGCDLVKWSERCASIPVITGSNVRRWQWIYFPFYLGYCWLPCMYVAVHERSLFACLLCYPGNTLCSQRLEPLGRAG